MQQTHKSSDDGIEVDKIGGMGNTIEADKWSAICYVRASLLMRVMFRIIFKLFANCASDRKPALSFYGQ
jgi:hypothetical protein